MVFLFFLRWKLRLASFGTFKKDSLEADSNQTFVNRFRKLHAQHRAVLHVNASLNGEIAFLKKTVVVRNALLNHIDSSMNESASIGDGSRR